MWTQDLNRHLTKEHTNIANKHIERCSNHMSSDKLKQRDTTTHLLEWPKSRTLATPNAGKSVDQQKLLLIAGGNVTWYSHFGRQFGGFFEK